MQIISCPYRYRLMNVKIQSLVAHGSSSGMTHTKDFATFVLRQQVAHARNVADASPTFP